MFYVAMASGAVGVVSPISALGGLGPIVLSLLTGDQPTITQYLGLVLALMSGRRTRVRSGRHLGLMAGVGVGSLYPVVTALLAWWFFDERLKPIQYLGVASWRGHATIRG